MSLSKSSATPKGVAALLARITMEQNRKCETRDRMLQDWVLSADAYAGLLAALARHCGHLSVEAEARIAENVERAMSDCESIREGLASHRTEHGC